MWINPWPFEHFNIRNVDGNKLIEPPKAYGVNLIHSLASGLLPEPPATGTMHTQFLAVGMAPC